MITIATNCADRKEMVRKLSAHLGIPAVYLRTPTYAFRIGEITVNRDASVSGEREALLPAAEFLMENGYISELPADLTADDSEAPDDKTTTSSEPDCSDPEEITTMALRIYEPDWTVQSMTNFMHMLYAHQDLINRMLQMNSLRIDDVFIQNLASTCLTCVSDFETVLHDAVRAGQVTGVNLDAGAVTVDLPYEQDSIRWVFYFQLISACIKAAKNAKRVLPRRLDSEADKYHANAWLNRLGFGGSEYKELRRTLMGHLNGYAAFKSEDRMQAHKNRLAEQRRIRHEENEEANEHD